MDRSEFRRQQLVGALTGLIGGAVAGGYWPELRASIGWYGTILWGMVIGLAIASFPKFGIVGQRITGRESPALNFIVGTALLVAIVVVLLTVAGLILG